ncbi:MULTISPECIES: NAD-dependent protein deacylase [Aerococcus]|nr:MULTISPECIES: NAD-dependent protein deacylase [Aerococcus]MDK6369148.1 NAD-dependent protein deacylase [Aerococcus sp. UMB9870]MDK6679792.1 NAD-dependent protein deacylase [Aerococcus sp. UMB8608]MDK6686641.1 NAD-dependent protein deacylase [Aerococcus sp. UMB8623]MDK6939714.1 NAD-dependent protein deacylase [Aerococcus sp. UMB8487]
MEKIDKLQSLIDQSQNLVFFGGAGVSTESGIPDFRSSEGLYSKDQERQIPAEEVISHHYFMAHPESFFDFYFEHLVFPEAKPNPAHRYLADLEARGKEVTVITQNIDGLHQKAGSQKVIELHGSVWRNYCMDCGQAYDYEDLLRDESGIPRCQKDQGIVRPDIVLYEESLDASALSSAVRALGEADLLIIAGTSLVVYPAAGLINYYAGQDLVLINKSPLQVPKKQSLTVFQDAVGRVFSHLD